MGFTSAVDWWEEWQLRILVLTSQSVQWLLLLSARRRKSGISASSQVLIWLAYHGSDAMVIYALAALFNRPRRHYANPTSPHGNSVLEAVWAPVLLMHLGGQYCITACNMVDIELWRRHALIAVSQITVSVYVFCKSWSGGDKRLLQAAIILFTIGGIKCLEKPFALQKASLHGLVSSSDTGSSTKIHSLDKYVRKVCALYQATRHEGDLEANRPPDQAQGEGDVHTNRLPGQAQGEVDVEANRLPGRAQGEVDVEANHLPGQAQGEGDVETNRLSGQAQGEVDVEANHLQGQAQGEGDLEANRLPDQAQGKGDVHTNRLPGQAQKEVDVEANRLPGRAQGEVDVEANHLPGQAQGEADLEANHLPGQAQGEVDLEANHLPGRAQGEADVEANHLPGRAQGEGDVETNRLPGQAGEVDVEANHLPGRAQREADVEANHLPGQAQGEGDVETNRLSGQAQGEVDVEANHLPGQAQGEGDVEANRLPYQAQRERDAKGKDQVNKLFVDLASPYSDRLAITESFLNLDGKGAYELLQKSLSRMFNLLYTKANIVPDIDVETCFWGHVFWFALRILPFAAIGLFHRSNREAYDDNDVKVTYTLLCCTAMMELFSSPPFFGWSKLSGRVAQYSFMGFFACNKNYTTRVSMKHVNRSSKITRLVHQQVKGWWKHHIHDAADYMRFNNHRGQWAIEQAKCGRLLGWSIKRSFDESVLLWHIATDLCFYNMGIRSDYVAAEECREISNYMMYLLFAKPEMLMAGTRPNLVKAAYRQLNRMVGSGGQPLVDGRALAQILVAKVEESPNGGYFVHDAWKLSKKLSSLNDKKMWKVIRGVWVEMLCYSASRCRGYLHAKSLGTGGELLTFIWLMWSHMGMVTLVERMQMPDQDLEQMPDEELKVEEKMVASSS